MAPHSCGARGLRWCLRRQAALALMASGVRGGIEGSWSPIVRLHGWEAQPQEPNPQLATRALRIGWASNLVAFGRGRVWIIPAPNRRATARFVEHLLLQSGGG